MRLTDRGWSAAALVLGLTGAGPIGTATAQATAPKPPVIVVVHGAWGGGWAWQGVARTLADSGRIVYRPTMTGLGERAHLASPDIGLDTHIADIVAVLEWEGLDDVVLVGHSYGGVVITGVAERVPQRIRHLVYLDAILPFDGECALNAGLWRHDRCDPVDPAAVPGDVSADGFLIPTWAAGKPIPTDVPQSLRTFTDPIQLAGPPGHGLPATYVITRSAPGADDAFDWAAERARGLGWPVRELIADHTPYRSAPEDLVALLLSIP